MHNRGGFASVVFSRDGKEAPGAGARGWWPEGMLHEITHNLGGVQWSAPHSTQPVGLQDPRYGHCWQGYDVMCYLEDAGAAHAMRNDCPRIGGAIPQTYDCGHDDYFNPSPAARQLPRDALERLRQRLPRLLRRHHARLRRWHGRPRARASGRHHRPRR